MAVPKSKHSSTRRDSRRSANMKMTAPALSLCTQCGELKTPHRVCSSCGFYKGTQVIAKAD